MKISKYFKLVFLLFFACNNNSKKIESIDKFNLKITFVGNIDKPLPTLNFSDSHEENFKLFNYNYSLNYTSYIEIKNQFEKLGKKIRNNSSLVYISFNKKQSYYLDKKEGLLFIFKLLEIKKYKGNEQLKNQLNLYLNVLKSR